MRYELIVETFNDADSGIYDSARDALDAVLRTAEENGWLYSHNRDMKTADPDADSYHGQFFERDGRHVWEVFDWRVIPYDEAEEK